MTNRHWVEVTYATRFNNGEQVVVPYPFRDRESAAGYLINLIGDAGVLQARHLDPKRNVLASINNVALRLNRS